MTYEPTTLQEQLAEPSFHEPQQTNSEYSWWDTEWFKQWLERARQ